MSSKDVNAFEAMLAVQLPGTVTPAEAPSEVQWMPPGRHTINASRGGKPVQLDVIVDESGAERVAASYLEYKSAADRGEGDLPFWDFNHEDREASGHPQKFYWGGSHPQRGGIRAKVEWTGSGRKAIIGRDYSRFSPTFYVSESRQITGAPVCSGALVNRAAFQRISPILSKHEEAAILSGGSDFLTKAGAIAKARNLALGDACEVLARENPRDYDHYCAQLWGRPLPMRAQRAEFRSNENDEFLVRARALASALDMGLDEAVSKLAREQPSLYERYRARLFDIDLVAPVAAQARSDNSSFFVRAKAIAGARGIDITEAFDLVARESPELYDAFRASL